MRAVAVGSGLVGAVAAGGVSDAVLVVLIGVVVAYVLGAVVRRELALWLRATDPFRFGPEDPRR